MTESDCSFVFLLHGKQEASVFSFHPLRLLGEGKLS